MDEHHARDLIDTYFARAAAPDHETYLALLADDVVVEDEGRERHGIDAVREWRAEVPSVTYTVRGVTPTVRRGSPSRRSRATSPAARST